MSRYFFSFSIHQLSIQLDENLKLNSTFFILSMISWLCTRHREIVSRLKLQNDI